MIKGLLSKARRLAEERLPPEVVQAGKRLRDEVVRRVPPEVAEVIERYARDEPEVRSQAPEAPRSEAAKREVEPEAKAEPASKPEPEAKAEPEPASKRESEPEAAPLRREDPNEVLQRVKAKADKGLKPEDRLVVVYATTDEADEVAQILEALRGVDAIVRQMDLNKEPPQTRTQLAKLTGVMVPPWVYINGKYWGGPYEMIALQASGDLELVVANRLDEIGAEARRIGGVHESYSEDITVENLLARWKLGHVLTVDDLDTWYEVDRDGTERFYHQGGPVSAEDMGRIAQEIVQGVDAEELEVEWHLEASVSLS